MSTTEATHQSAGMSPRTKARVAGAFEFLEGAAASVGQVLILERLVVANDPAATATRILANGSLYWFGFAASMLGVIFHLVWAVLFYELLKPVNRTLARAALAIVLVCCALQAVTALLYAAPWMVLHGAEPFAAFTTSQLQALAYLFLRLNARAFDADLVFFGAWCVLTGYLIFRSRFLPRLLGVLLVIDGIGWMLYLVPSFGRQIFPFAAAASALAEFPLQLWLLVVGLNEQKWKEQAAASLERS